MRAIRQVSAWWRYFIGQMYDMLEPPRSAERRLRRGSVRAKLLIGCCFVLSRLLLAELVIDAGEDQVRFRVRRIQTSRFAKLGNGMIQLALIFKNSAELEMCRNKGWIETKRFPQIDLSV